MPAPSQTRSCTAPIFPFVPAEAGTQRRASKQNAFGMATQRWIPASAGMSGWRGGSHLRVTDQTRERTVAMLNAIIPPPEIAYKPRMRLAALLMFAFALVTAHPARAEDFNQWLAAQWPAAQAMGVSRATFDNAVRGLTPDPTLPDLDIP